MNNETIYLCLLPSPISPSKLYECILKAILLLSNHHPSLKKYTPHNFYAELNIGIMLL